MKPPSKHILIISYYSKPFNSVGVKRTDYWFEHLPEYGFSTTKITAIPQTINQTNIIFVSPDSKKPILSYFIKDQGINWIKPLKTKLKDYSRNAFSHIIITGGPFMQMILSKWIKSQFSASLILDFRDPFFANPRFKTSLIKDSIKKFFQNRFLKNADIVITVNVECAKNIHFNNIEIIDNGFDEKVVNRIKHNNQEKNQISNPILIGRIDSDFDLQPLIHVLSSQNLTFHYAGNYRFNEQANQIIHYGNLTYEELLEKLYRHKVCILLTTGYPFESTTKIFDFLAYNKIILIVTQGDIKTGSLHEITKNYPNTFWAKNNRNSLEETLHEVNKHIIKPYNTEVFSRKEGLKKLVKLIDQ
ncbi:MAG: hypothetical protein JXR34_11995 [Bacteroidales bacterium]|nr:hypothetical protein [Bacteroidales bacterium]